MSADGYRPPLKRPIELAADIVRFKNGDEDWIAFVGIYNDRPYEIFTGKMEEDAMFIPKKIKKGVILKVKEPDGTKRYDFQYKDKYGYTNTIGGISRLFNKEFWNYAKLISGVLRNGMPILDVVYADRIAPVGQRKASIRGKPVLPVPLKQYIANGTKSKEKCPNCGQETLGLPKQLSGMYELRLFQVRIASRQTGKSNCFPAGLGRDGVRFINFPSFPKPEGKSPRT